MVALRPQRRVALLSLAALGVVFGDIGTSPLYAFRLCFFAGPGYAARAENVLGILWALILVVCIKYATFVLRADFEGEGGTLALLAPIPRSSVSKRLPWFAFMLLLGVAMLYGDGVITPAISVLSAVEGLNVATTAMRLHADALDRRHHRLLGRATAGAWHRIGVLFAASPARP
jgi:KUP system potassium uptake protein